ncbi:MAG TPA: Calx-beta domain-containing protein, partial [Terriglobia bacterium]|nr:Calx-beta domain-containing protein [Terriglobia bacterium]
FDRPRLSIADVTVTEGNNGTSAAEFTVTRLGATAESITVDYATVDGTALAGSDYTGVSGKLIFAPNESTKQIIVPVIGDTSVESNETFTLVLANPTNASISDGLATGTITNNDFPALTISDVAVAEGNSGTTAAAFTVTLSEAYGLPITVNYATVNGTAKSNGDFQAQAGMLTFGPGQTVQQISINVDGDLFTESDETFLVSLNGAVNATIAGGQGEATILNDDSTPTLNVSDVIILEGDGGTTAAVFTVSLTGVVTEAVIVNYATADGTASAGSDYVATSGTLTFNSGPASAEITVLVNGDTQFEPAETFSFILASITGGIVQNGVATGHIENDDTRPLIV